MSDNEIVDMVLRFIGKEKLCNLKKYIDDCINRKYIEFLNHDEVLNVFLNNINDFIKSLEEVEKNNLIMYTGLSFRNVNAVLRNKWNYEINGKWTLEEENNCKEMAEIITEALNKFKSVSLDFKTFRAVSINAFYGYGVSKLGDLINMKGRFMYEGAFSSTSMFRNKSFMNLDRSIFGKPNILVELKIPSESEDGALLYSDNLSFAKSQAEYLINSSSLFYVEDVVVNELNKEAHLTCLLVPRKMWDNVIENEKNETL